MIPVIISNIWSVCDHLKNYFNTQKFVRFEIQIKELKELQQFGQAHTWQKQEKTHWNGDSSEGRISEKPSFWRLAQRRQDHRKYWFGTLPLLFFVCNIAKFLKSLCCSSRGSPYIRICEDPQCALISPLYTEDKSASVLIRDRGSFLAACYNLHAICKSCPKWLFFVLGKQSLLSNILM